MACGACNFLKRKCDEGCVFAPYICFENMGATQFRAIHKVFGASNFSKLLQNVPEDKRCDAVTTISYEAEAWIKNPIQGFLSNVFSLQKEIDNLNQELAAGYAELAACGTSNEASLSAEYVDNKQSQMPSVISNSNPNVQQYFPWPIDIQSILSVNTTPNTYRAEAEKAEQGSCNNFPLCAQWDISSLARGTTQQQVPMEMNALHFGHGAGKWSHQKHPNINNHVLDPRPIFG